MPKIRTYRELIHINNFNDRFEYLKLNGVVGKSTFGFDRYINQLFYNSEEWKEVRNKIIVRDNGFDLAMNDFSISSRILIHHMNPILIEDIVNNSEYLLNPEYLVSASVITHNAIHYGSEVPTIYSNVERRPNDTCLWKIKNERMM